MLQVALGESTGTTSLLKVVLVLHDQQQALSIAPAFHSAEWLGPASSPCHAVSLPPVPHLHYRHCYTHVLLLLKLASAPLVLVQVRTHASGIE